MLPLIITFYTTLEENSNYIILKWIVNFDKKSHNILALVNKAELCLIVHYLIFCSADFLINIHLPHGKGQGWR